MNSPYRYGVKRPITELEVAAVEWARAYSLNDAYVVEARWEEFWTSLQQYLPARHEYLVECIIWDGE